MISFIVIGQNEGWRLSLCLKSVFDSANKSWITDFEVIYVDSSSVDDSIEIAKGYGKIKIIQIEGKCSAAIARNIGAQEAKGDILAFLDGDMKLHTDFLCKAISENGNLIYPFLTGAYNHCYYDLNHRVIGVKSFDIVKDNILVKVTGGFFMVTKALWQKVGGMDSRLDRNEDLDLGLRLCQINMPPLKLAKTCIDHYTFKDKLSANLLKCALYYRFSAVVARKHLLNIHYWPMALRMNYTSFFLFAAILLSLVTSYFLLLYVLLILVRAFANEANRNSKMIVYYCLRDIVFVVCFFTYYPGSSEIMYKACSVDGTSI